MVRNKVKLQYISNNAARRTSLKNRQRSLLKKVHEISVLCGVDACGIVYNPEEPTEPQVWPQPQDATKILMKFYDLPEKERTRKMTNHLAYMQDRVATLKKKVVKCDKDNDKLEVRTNLCEGLVDKDFVGLTDFELSAVGEAVDELIAKIYSRISCMSAPPEARDEDCTGAERGVVVEQVAVPATPTTIASAEAGPSNQAKQGSEFSVEESGDDESGDDESSDDENELGDTEDEDDDE